MKTVSLFQTVALLSAVSKASKSCASTVSASVPEPSVAPGYEVHLVAGGLSAPRGILFDSEGHLLVVQQDVGIEGLTLHDDGKGCITSTDRKVVVDNSALNHGIELSPDGKTLYASSTESAFSFPYHAKTMSTGANTTLVSNMTNTDHTTRTLLLSRKMPGMLMVARGSTSNIDPLAKKLSTGHSQIKAFNLNKRGSKPYSFDTNGRLLGWGLRNDVGVAEHPDGGLYSVENSVDQMTRDGVDIHEDNPAEEMNYLGTLKDNKSPNQGQNFGYPECFTAWNVSAIPKNRGLKPGMQFAIGTSDHSKDTRCRNQRVAPRLGFQAHMAPLDIKFNTKGTEAFITFHGSWDRDPPVGYKVGLVKFANGEPVEPSTSITALEDIVKNKHTGHCPNKCFRPVGLAWDSKGRLFFSSDQTGEVYVITKKGAKNGSVDPNAPSMTFTGMKSSSPQSTASKISNSFYLSIFVFGLSCSIYYLT